MTTTGRPYCAKCFLYLDSPNAEHKCSANDFDDSIHIDDTFTEMCRRVALEAWEESQRETDAYERGCGRGKGFNRWFNSEGLKILKGEK